MHICTFSIAQWPTRVSFLEFFQNIAKCFGKHPHYTSLESQLGMWYIYFEPRMLSNLLFRRIGFTNQTRAKIALKLPPDDGARVQI